MKLNIIAAAILGLTASLSTATAWGGANDYAFEAVQPQVKSGANQEIAVRLVHKPGGHQVSGAVIFQTRLDMAPDGMAEMTTKIVAASSTEPGVYRFKADFTMAGRWQLTLAAKVQGETETIKGAVVFTAAD